MDYGFAPGTDRDKDKQDDSMRKMFFRRSDTKLINKRRISTLRGFINHLNTADGIERPVDDFLFGSHANNQGVILKPMFPKQRGATKFEILQDTLVTPDHSIAIPDDLIGFSPGDDITHSFHFIGCNLGKALPFMEKFKEALGDHVKVTAPKHFHGLTPAPKQGMFEYMCYEFTIRRTEPFEDRDEAIEEFQAGGFEQIDPSSATGVSPVPDDAWEKWIPKKINKTRQQQIPISLAVSIGRRKTINTPRQFRVDTAPYIWTIEYEDAGSVPVSNADRLQALEDSLKKDGGRPYKDGPSRFDEAHEFPNYKRFGYSSFDEFFEAYDWCRTVKGQEKCCTKHGKLLVCVGRRVVYTVVVAITDPTTGHLIFNFYPNPGSPHDEMTDGLQPDDTDFFVTV